MSKIKEALRPTLHAHNVVCEAIERAKLENRVPRILFVCLGNICRSPAAQGITEQMAEECGVAVECDSAGFYGGHAGDLPDRRMREAALARRYRLDHRARKIRSYDLDEFDIVIGMDDNNIADLHALADTEARDKRIVRMTDFAVGHPEYESVPDPYYEGVAGFHLVLDLLEDACGTLLNLFSKKIVKDKKDGI